MAVSQREAVYLWNNITKRCALFHLIRIGGLPTILSDRTRVLSANDDTDREEVAQFLRVWADALDPKPTTTS